MIKIEEKYLLIFRKREGYKKQQKNFNSNAKNSKKGNEKRKKRTRDI